MSDKDIVVSSRENYESALERAERAERELAEVRRAAKSCIADAQTEKDMATAELERAQKACAEMRAALKWMWEKGEMGYVERPGLPKECGECGRAGGHSDECWQSQVERGLSSDAGRDFFHRDDFEILVEALRELEAHPDARHQIVQVCKRTIAAAHEKGIIS